MHFHVTPIILLPIPSEARHSDMDLGLANILSKDCKKERSKQLYDGEKNLTRYT
jgi:hypothetical protein